MSTTTTQPKKRKKTKDEKTDVDEINIMINQTCFPDYCGISIIDIERHLEYFEKTGKISIKNNLTLDIENQSDECIIPIITESVWTELNDLINIVNRKAMIGNSDPNNKKKNKSIPLPYYTWNEKVDSQCESLSLFIPDHDVGDFFLLNLPGDDEDKIIQRIKDEVKYSCFWNSRQSATQIFNEVNNGDLYCVIVFYIENNHSESSIHSRIQLYNIFSVFITGLTNVPYETSK